jgi:probable HAF family extracellular repeat protein
MCGWSRLVAVSWKGQKIKTRETINVMKSLPIRAAINSLAIATTIQIACAQSYTTASAINNSGEIIGGTCLYGCTEFHATLLGRSGLVDFGTFGGPGSLAYGVNDCGQAVGQSDSAELSEDGQFISLAFIADGNGVRSLGTLPGYRFSQAFAINNRGVSVGWAYNSPAISTAPPRAVMFLGDGTIHELGTLGGASSVAFALNDREQIAGRSRTSNGEQHAFVYEDGIMKDLGTLGGNLSTARAINSRKWIVGGARRTVAGPLYAFVVIQGVMSELGTLGGNYSEAFGINNAGLIVGAAHTTSGEPHAFTYFNGTMTDLGTLGGRYSLALGVNDRGDVVGEAETTHGDVHAFLHRDGIMHDLTLCH